MTEDDSTHTSTWPALKINLGHEEVQMPWVEVKDTSPSGSGVPVPDGHVPDELEQIEECVSALDHLPEDAACRAVMYLHDRYVTSVRDPWR